MKNLRKTGNDTSSRPFRGSPVAAVAVAGLLGTAWAFGSHNAEQRFDSETGVSPLADTEVQAYQLATTDWDLPNLDHERIDFWIGRFTTDKRGDFTKFLERSGRYGPMISQKLAERGMPQDLIYLAMIESGMNPTAYSPAHASGLWQFIAETGQRYGLTVNRVVDERNDPVKSTDAALDYLTYLHNRLGSWYLAAAGYNTGENRVARIMREETGSEKGTEEDFYRIWDRLPRETRDYVPLMIAAARIAKEPAKYGFENVVFETPLAFEEVPVDAGTPLSAVAEASGVDAKEIKRLNPHYKQSVTPNGKRALVRIPEGTRTAFLVNWTEVREKKAYAATDYKVRKGDSLLAIAQRHGVTATSLRQENAIRGDRIRAGETIRIPTQAR
ncbi:MAG: transglycosylase SLT domain-containing protein [Gemmatimonadetes bacterium]|nr:transglycosylase SLT domain-containing protein [Gemmatimonadota bacterium]